MQRTWLVGLISCPFASLEHRARLPFHVCVELHSLILWGCLPKQSAHAVRVLLDVVSDVLENDFLLRGGDADLDRPFLR